MEKFLKWSCACLAGCLLTAEGMEAPKTRSLSVNGETLQRYYQNKFRVNMMRYRCLIEAAATREDAQKLVRTARQRVSAAFTFPSEKCALAARVVGMESFPEFMVEKILFQSRKNFTVTANFYLPKQRNGKVPAVLFLAGHAEKGKADSAYVKIPAALARKGCAVLAIDPIHQGERRQFPATAEPGLCPAHNILNRQLLAVGESMADWRCYDGIRAIDYLLTRSEIDPARIGVNGNSGGGTLTAMVAACDERVAAAAPACYVTTFLHNVENELPADGEQMPRGFLADGGEMADLVLAQAPRPFRILSQNGDFFDARGTDETYSLLKKIYTLLGAPENISIVRGSGGHGYSEELRCGAYDFFNTVFQLGSDGKEPAGVLPTYEQLRCLPEGGVSQLSGEKNVRDFLAERMEELRKDRADRPKSHAEMREALARLLKLTTPEKVPHYRILRPYFPKPEGSTPLMRFALETEPGMSVTLFAPGDGGTFGIPVVMKSKAELYLPHLACREEMPQLPEIFETVRFGLDYRGIGETEPNGCDQWNREFAAEYNYDYHYASLGVLLGEPLIGRRVYDVLCAMKLLRENGVRELTLRASGYGMIPAVFAAVLSPEPVKLVLGGKIITYEEAGHCLRSPIPQSFVPEGILKLADLDELIKLCNYFKEENHE